jgi:DNA-binding GntR family transcriptional regulator
VARSGAVSRMVLSDQVKDHLLRAILAGRFAPGERIIETRVARDLGVSQAPVREALRDLENLGLVESSPFRGARVRHPSTAELIDAIAVRAQLEALGLRLAFERLSAADLSALHRSLDEMREAARTADAYAEAKADAAFHGLLIDVAGNAVLRRQWHAIEPFSRTYITLVSPGADQHVIADLHGGILAALDAGDRGAALDALARHFESTERTLRQAETAGAGPVQGEARIPAIEAVAAAEAEPRGVPAVGAS